MSAVLNHSLQLPGAWRRALTPLLLSLALVLLLYRDTFAAMVGIWYRSDTFAHAFLVPPIAIWLVWRRRALLASFSPQPQWGWLLPLALAALAWLVGELAGVNALTQFAATAMLVITVPLMLGWPLAREMSFALAFLFFMVPFGEFVMPTLMNWTAEVTVFALKVFGVPVYREGLQFVIPTGSWSVIEACSGVRYLIASFMVGTLFAYLNYRSTRRRVLFGVVALLVPIVANWARAVMIVMLGHLSHNKLAVGVDHIIYGWVFFGIVVTLMYTIGAWWSEPAGPAAAPPVSGTSVVAPSHQRSSAWPLALAMAALLALTSAAAWHLENQAVAKPVLALPELPGVGSVPGQKPLNQPIFPGARVQAVRVYGSGPQAVTVHVAYYRQQTFGHKLVDTQNELVKSTHSDWNRASSGTTTLHVAGQALSLRTAELREGNVAEGAVPGRLQVRQIYWVGCSFTSNDIVAGLLGLFGQLSGRGDDAAAITFYFAGDNSPANEHALDNFVEQSLPRLAQTLAAVRAAR